MDLNSLFGSIKKKNGMLTPNLPAVPTGGPAPIDYGRIRSILNSGVLRGGQPMPAPPPEIPEPAQAQQPTSIQALLASLFGGRL